MEVVFYSIYIFVALLVSCTAVAILGFGLHWERFFRPYVAPLIAVAILFAIGASSIVSERDVSLYGLSGSVDRQFRKLGWKLDIAIGNGLDRRCFGRGSFLKPTT